MRDSHGVVVASEMLDASSLRRTGSCSDRSRADHPASTVDMDTTKFRGYLSKIDDDRVVSPLSRVSRAGDGAGAPRAARGRREGEGEERARRSCGMAFCDAVEKRSDDRYGRASGNPARLFLRAWKGCCGISARSRRARLNRPHVLRLPGHGALLSAHEAVSCGMRPCGERFCAVFHPERREAGQSVAALRLGALFRLRGPTRPACA